MNRSVLARQMFAKGGQAVPNEYKGFSMLPESVQMKMDPVAAKKYQEGGEIRAGISEDLRRDIDRVKAQLIEEEMQQQRQMENITALQALRNKARYDVPLLGLDDVSNVLPANEEGFNPNNIYNIARFFGENPGTTVSDYNEFFKTNLDPRDFSVLEEKAEPPAVGMAMGGDPAMAQGVGSMMPPPPAMPPPPPPMEGGQAIAPQLLESALAAAEQEITSLDEAEDFETVMNTIRGDEATVEERYEELASVVGEEDARQTPESVLTLVQPAMVMGAVDQGIGGLAQQEMMEPVQGAMAQGIMSTVEPPQPTGGMGGPPPVNFKDGGLVRRGDNQPVLKFAQAGVVPGPFAGVEGRLGELARERMAARQGIIGDPSDRIKQQEDLTKSQMLFDIANTALAFAAPIEGERPGASAAERLAMAARATQLPQTIGARAAKLGEFKTGLDKEKQALQLAALGSAETALAAEAKAAAELEREQVRQAGAISQIKLKDKLNLATSKALSELGYAQKLGLQEAAAGQRIDLEKILQDGRMTLAEFGAVKEKELEIQRQQNREALATLRGSIDFNTRTDLQAQAAEIAKEQAEIDSQLRINELGVGLENSKILSDYRGGIAAKAAELQRNFEAEQAELNRKLKEDGLDISREQLALDEKYKMGKLEIDRMVAEEEKVGSDAKTAQLKFLTDPERRRKYVTGELGDETALYEQALIEYAKPSFTWNGTSYVKNPTPQLAPALQQTLNDRKANGFEIPTLPGLKTTTTETEAVSEVSFDSTEFKQDLLKDGAVNFDSPGWDRIPETVISSDIAYERATGISEIPARVGRRIAEFGRELGLSTGPTEDQSEITTAERDILNLKEEILQVVNNMSEDRVLKATQDAIRANAEPFTPGIFKFDESAAATLNGLKKQLGRAFAEYAKKDPLYNPEAEGMFNEDQVLKARDRASYIRTVLKDVITLENAYRVYFDAEKGSRSSRREGRKDDGGVSAQDVISRLQKQKAGSN